MDSGEFFPSSKHYNVWPQAEDASSFVAYRT